MRVPVAPVEQERSLRRLSQRQRIRFMVKLEGRIRMSIFRLKIKGGDDMDA